MYAIRSYYATKASMLKMNLANAEIETRCQQQTSAKKGQKGCRHSDRNISGWLQVFQERVRLFQKNYNNQQQHSPVQDVHTHRQRSGHSRPAPTDTTAKKCCQLTSSILTKMLSPFN